MYIKMDAPNAPNPANPNGQGQNADAEPGPANQAQGPVVQNQAQGPAVQNPAQGPADQNQVPSPHRSSSSARSHTGCLKCTCPTITTTGSYTTGPCWYRNACSLDFLSKLDREESRIFR